jgi:hypothetical protein
MRVIDVPQPDFPDITYFKGSHADGFVRVDFVARVNRDGSVTYEMDTKDEVELTVKESTDIAAVMKRYGDKKGVAVDVALKEVTQDAEVKK